MSTNKSISYLLCNKGIIVNLYKLHFLFSHFSTFPSLQPNTHLSKAHAQHVNELESVNR